MKSAMTNDIESANVINMLNLWVTPGMWQDKALFAEIKEVIQKLSEPSYQLSERELLITQELINGLLEATLVSFKAVDNVQKDELSLALNDITKLLPLLEVATDTH